MMAVYFRLYLEYLKESEFWRQRVNKRFKSALQHLPSINVCQIQINLCKIQIDTCKIKINLCHIQINLCHIQINLCQIQINIC